MNCGRAQDDDSLRTGCGDAGPCLRGFDCVCGSAPDRLPRPGGLFARRRLRDQPSGGRDAGGRGRRRVDRAPLSLLAQRRRPRTLPANPTNPNSYNWNAGDLQANVDAAQNHGLQVMLTIRSAPDWAQRGGHDSRGTHNPDPEKLKAFTQGGSRPLLGCQVLGRLERAELQDLPEPAVQERQARLARDVPQAAQQRGRGAPQPWKDRGCRRDRALLALEP